MQHLKIDFQIILQENWRNFIVFVLFLIKCAYFCKKHTSK